MISVLIPVYNQYVELDLVLKAFSKQDYKEPFEVVVVDDSSTDKRTDIIGKYVNLSEYSLKFKENKVNIGRAAARNRAVAASEGDILIFNDADRIPERSFLSDHIRCLTKNFNSVSIGIIKETYDMVDKVGSKDFTDIVARKAMYYNLISNIFDKAGKTDSNLCFLAFLIGNLAIRKDALHGEKFDETFTKWGFEHFELGFRLIEKYHLSILLNKGAASIHIAHSRSDMDYTTCIKESHQIFYKKHNVPKVNYMADFMLGNISLQDYETACEGTHDWMQGKKELFNKVFSL